MRNRHAVEGADLAVHQDLIGANARSTRCYEFHKQKISSEPVQRRDLSAAQFGGASLGP
jgi:hypothetical protein